MTDAQIQALEDAEARRARADQIIGNVMATVMALGFAAMIFCIALL